MKAICRRLTHVMLLSLCFGAGSAMVAAQAQAQCSYPPGAVDLYSANTAIYNQMLGVLPAATLNNLKTKTGAVVNAASYNSLLADVNTLTANLSAATGLSGRTLIALPDGTVMIDSAKGGSNTYANFQAKAINENHNSRAAIIGAQLFTCGYGVEIKTSTTTGSTETYLAVRLGPALNNEGTVRVSVK